MNKKILWAAAGVVIVSALAYAVWISIEKTAPLSDKGNGSVCTTDAMMCPDGSWVGRSGENCQFVCPIPQATSTRAGTVTVEAKVGQKIVPIKESITVLEVIEDSRCPHGVQCIQAGTVRVRAQVGSGSGTSVEIFKVGDTVTTESESMTLVSVRPEKEAGHTITLAEYSFIFRVTKR
jgi:hypothetical protein